MSERGKIIPFSRRPPPPPPAEPSSLVEVYRADQAEAVVLRSLLESEGIPIVCWSRISHSVHPFTVGEQGEVAILVPEIDAARARRLLGALTRRRSSR